MPKASVSKINGSGKSHAHKIQAVAMEQRAKEMGKSSHKLLSIELTSIR